MRHAVILAHPNEASFNASIAQACIDALWSNGDTVILRDLYAMGFDPKLRASELPTSEGFTPTSDVVAERAILGEVDSFIFIYPFWFNAPPAILKGYVDRVLSMGFGYGPTFGSTTPLLTGKSLLSVTTSGAPDRWVNSTGALNELMAVFDLHLGGVCGLSVLDHLHFGGIISNMTEEAASDVLGQIRTRLLGHFRT